MRWLNITIASLLIVPTAFASDTEAKVPAGGYYQTHWRTFDAIVSGRPIEEPKQEVRPAVPAKPATSPKPVATTSSKPIAAAELRKPSPVAAPTVVQAAALLPVKTDTSAPKAWMGKPMVPAPKILPTLGVPQ